MNGSLQPINYIFREMLTCNTILQTSKIYTAHQKTDSNPTVRYPCSYYAGMARVQEWLGRPATPGRPTLSAWPAGQSLTFDIKRISQRVMKCPAPSI